MVHIVFLQALFLQKWVTTVNSTTANHFLNVNICLKTVYVIMVLKTCSVLSRTFMQIIYCFFFCLKQTQASCQASHHLASGNQDFEIWLIICYKVCFLKTIKQIYMNKKQHSKKKQKQKKNRALFLMTYSSKRSCCQL